MRRGRHILAVYRALEALAWAAGVKDAGTTREAAKEALLRSPEWAALAGCIKWGLPPLTLTAGAESAYHKARDQESRRVRLVETGFVAAYCHDLPRQKRRRPAFAVTNFALRRAIIDGHIPTDPERECQPLDTFELEQPRSLRRAKNRDINRARGSRW